MKNFGKRLRRLRKERGLTQDDIAAAIGVSRQIISRWERNEAVPKAGNLTALADTLGISADYLLHGKTNFPATPPEIPVEVPLNEQILEIAELAEAVLETEEPNAPFLTVTSVPAPEVLSLLSENNPEEEIAESKLADEIAEKKKRKRLKWTLAEKIIVTISLLIVATILVIACLVAYMAYKILTIPPKGFETVGHLVIYLESKDIVIIALIGALVVAALISLFVIKIKRFRKKKKMKKELEDK